MNVLVNGRPTELPAGATVADVVARVDAPSRGIAVAVDAEVVPRGAWDRTPVEAGSRIEIVQAVQGG